MKKIKSKKKLLLMECAAIKIRNGLLESALEKKQQYINKLQNRIDILMFLSVVSLLISILG